MTDRAIGLLAEYALTKCDKVAALRLSPSVKPRVIRILAEYAFEDYSAVLPVKTCDCCNGSGFIDAVAFTNKVTYPDGKPPKWVKVTKGIYPSYWEEVKSVREQVGCFAKSARKRDC